MPRVHHRKARKDYPNNGISKGDMYFTWRIKATYGGTTYRSLTRPRQSQLTNSPFKSGFYAMGEAWEDDKTPDHETIRAASEAARELAEAANESYENMPEGLKEGDTGQMLYERSDQMESKADELEGLADEYEGLEEPEEPDEVIEPDHDGEQGHEETDEYQAFLDYEAARDEYESELASNEAERERIIEEASGLIGDMPE